MKRAWRIKMNKLVYDIGASNIKYAVMTNNGEIVSRSQVPTPRDSFEGYFGAIMNIYGENKEEVNGIAFSTNGRMMPDGNTYRAYTMGFLTGVNLKAEIELRTGLPVVVETDGYAAAIGEWWKGAAAGSLNTMAIVLGSGMGGGIILDGKPYRGSRQNAAMNFGMLSSADIENARYGFSGLETSFAAMFYFLAMEKQIDPAGVTGPGIFEWAAGGDEVTLRYLEKYYRAIAVTIFNSAVLLDLDCLVITGGLAQQSILIEGIRRNIRDISGKIPHMEGLDIDRKDADVGADEKDFDFDIRQGKLTADANLYGALYAFLNSSERNK